MAEVLIVDECPAIREGLEILLTPASGIKVVGKAANAKDALRYAAELRPSLVLVEPNFTGEKSRRSKVPDINLCQELKSLPHSPRVVFHTVHNYPADVAAATLAKADGFIHKSIQETELIRAVEDILIGDLVWLFGVSRKESDKLMHTSRKIFRLSPREQEILQLVLHRYSAREIASQLHVRPQTVRNHIVSIKRKLGYASRWELYEEWGV